MAAFFVLAPAVSSRLRRSVWSPGNRNVVVVLRPDERTSAIAGLLASDVQFRATFVYHYI